MLRALLRQLWKCVSFCHARVQEEDGGDDDEDSETEEDEDDEDEDSEEEDDVDLSFAEEDGDTHEGGVSQPEPEGSASQPEPEGSSGFFPLGPSTGGAPAWFWNALQQSPPQESGLAAGDELNLKVLCVTPSMLTNPNAKSWGKTTK